MRPCLIQVAPLRRNTERPAPFSCQFSDSQPYPISITTQNLPRTSSAVTLNLNRRRSCTTWDKWTRPRSPRPPPPIIRRPRSRPQPRSTRAVAAAAAATVRPCRRSCLLLYLLLAPVAASAPRLTTTIITITVIQASGTFRALLRMFLLLGPSTIHFPGC